jgi:hypothetical protein
VQASVHPPEKRYDDPNDEDAFCQNMLLLGAKWFDLYNRYTFLLLAEELDVDELEHSLEPGSTLGEQHWVSVAWPSTGGLVVADSGTRLWKHGKDDDDDFVPTDVVRLKLCANMDEMAEVLKGRFGGKTLANVMQYKGREFLNP